MGDHLASTLNLKGKLFCFGLLVQPWFSWTHIQNKGACYLRLPLWFVALLQLRFVCSRSLWGFNLSCYSSVLLRALIAICTACYEQRKEVFGVSRKLCACFGHESGLDRQGRGQTVLKMNFPQLSFLSVSSELDRNVFWQHHEQWFKVGSLRTDQGMYIHFHFFLLNLNSIRKLGSN